jgi:hypothetical protein
MDASNDALLADFARLLPDARAATDAISSHDPLSELYSGFPLNLPHLPKLYERLIVQWKWNPPEPSDEELLMDSPGSGYPLTFRFLGNGEDETPFHTLLKEMQKDKVIWNLLIQTRYVPFGRGGLQGYDPVCFDLNRKRGDDCPIVSLHHEEILCYDRIKIALEIASSFRELIQMVIAVKEKSRRNQDRVL